MSVSDYTTRKYNNPHRWMNFWHQINEINSRNPESVLEVGKGSGLVSNHLRAIGYTVTTVDIDRTTKPNIVASVEKIPVKDNSHDVVLAAEILEHIPVENVSRALQELGRISKRYVIISLPYKGGRFLWRLKIPFIPEFRIFIPIPFFWRQHMGMSYSGHYWNIGERSWSRKRIRQILRDAGFTIEKEKIFHDDFNHIMFILVV